MRLYTKVYEYNIDEGKEGFFFFSTYLPDLSELTEFEGCNDELSRNLRLSK